MDSGASLRNPQGVMSAPAAKLWGDAVGPWPFFYGFDGEAPG